MCATRIDPFEDADNLYPKSSPNGTPIIPSLLVRPSTSQIVPAQTAVLADVAIIDSLTLTQNTEAIAAYGVVGSVSLTAPIPLNQTLPNDEISGALSEALDAFSQGLLNTFYEGSTSVVSVKSLSEPSLVQVTPMTNIDELLGLTSNNISVPRAYYGVVLDFSNLQLQMAPVVTTSQSSLVLVLVDNVNNSVVIDNLIAPLVVVENFVNTGTGTLTVTTAGANVHSLSLDGNINFTLTNNQVASGVSILAGNDNGDVTLYLHGGSSNQSGTDFIDLGNGNNFVLDTNAENILFSFGNGNNTVLLIEQSVSGLVSFGNHSQGVTDFVTLGANLLAGQNAQVSPNLITIAGLNNGPNSSDALAFLNDMNNQLVWSNGSAMNAQVTGIVGDPNNLVNWIHEAQHQANNPHSVSWFQFNGDTYLLETAMGDVGNHIGDTLVKIVGITHFTGPTGELAIGMLHFLG